jgi:hypothetical protein
MLFIKLAINNHDLLITNISPFFLICSYYIKLMQIELAAYINNHGKSLIKKRQAYYIKASLS